MSNIQVPVHQKGKRILGIYTTESETIKDTLMRAYPNDEFISLSLDKIENLNFNEYLAKTGNVDIIYFLSGISPQRIDFNDLEALEKTQEKGVMSLFRLVRSLIQQGYMDQSLQLKILTNNVHEVVPGMEIQPYGGSIHGFVRSMAKECSSWDISCIDISIEDIQGTMEGIESIVQQIMEESGHPLGEEIALRAGKRYVRTAHPLVLPNVKDTPFRHQGVYLILGGSGGIGLELSHYLAKTVQARLVLIGRSELNDWKRQKIQEIESCGGKVKYIRADALELESMKRAVAEAKETFGSIHGVIHSAIVLQDKTLQNMDEEMFKGTLNPKVRGSAVLYESVRGEKLDFMMFFSSAQSFMGNLGQSNYAAACTFKDAYANYLNQREAYPVKIINWGYWGSVGVVSNDEYNKRMEL
ncbi:SDR family NAD(P)-dependent oxidoreductase, partial [Bacillus wiedmannii]|uniref:SDR family NAD(P)-dependent oxidoreductase n=1 Tax=Bacillus wiedmannii TaxID=1890302 RepID=UPI000BFAE379